MNNGISADAAAHHRGSKTHKLCAKKKCDVIWVVYANTHTYIIIFMYICTYVCVCVCIPASGVGAFFASSTRSESTARSCMCAT